MKPTTPQQYIGELEAHVKAMQKALDQAADWIRDVKAALGVDSTADVIPAIRRLQGAKPLEVEGIPQIITEGVEIPNAKA